MAGLDPYRAKRNFKHTPEPPGRVGRAKAAKRRFVVQRHAATRLHYDFRLELDGAYKSWAVTKVPSLDPATKRLAVEVEDHPLDYGTFEGIIPQGQYGGGAVQLWDRGTWEPQSVDPQSDLANGHLKIVLDGRRLRGGWALIRMRDRTVQRGGAVRHNWLLIKEKDAEAVPGEPDALAAEDTSIATGRTLDEIASARRKRVSNARAKAGKLPARAAFVTAPSTRIKKRKPARTEPARNRKPAAR
jgi:bifunctional non-homologous end joining protein LigD